MSDGKYMYGLAEPIDIDEISRIEKYKHGAGYDIIMKGSSTCVTTHQIREACTVQESTCYWYMNYLTIEMCI